VPEPLPAVRRVAVPTPTLPPATTTNCWVLGNRRVTVVDPASPWPAGQQAVADALDGFEVERIVLTHHHPDHVGGVLDLRERCGAPVLAHRLTAERVPFAVDGLLDEGSVLRTDTSTWQVLHTPGHATGHLCLHDEEAHVLVVGDMVASEGTIVLDPPEGELGAYLASLQRLAALEPRVLLPAHGTAIPDDGRAGGAVAWLQAYIAHRNMRTQQVRVGLRAHPDGARPADLVPVIYADVPAFIYPVAERQVLCHLLWLVGQGEVRQAGERFTLQEGRP